MVWLPERAKKWLPRARASSFDARNLAKFDFQSDFVDHLCVFFLFQRTTSVHLRIFAIFHSVSRHGAARRDTPLAVGAHGVREVLEKIFAQRGVPRTPSCAFPSNPLRSPCRRDRVRGENNLWCCTVRVILPSRAVCNQSLFSWVCAEFCGPPCLLPCIVCFICVRLTASIWHMVHMLRRWCYGCRDRKVSRYCMFPVMSEPSPHHHPIRVLSMPLPRATCVLSDGIGAGRQ